MRKEPILDFAARPEPGPLKEVVDVLTRTIGRTVAIGTVPMLTEVGGHVVTDAATTPGTALAFTRTFIDLADAGVDNLRLVVRAKNSVAGSVTVQLYDVTSSVVLCTVVVTGTTETTYAGAWVTVVPGSDDRELELRVVGDGAADPTIYTAQLQMRTTQARR